MTTLKKILLRKIDKYIPLVLGIIYYFLYRFNSETGEIKEYFLLIDNSGFLFSILNGGIVAFLVHKFLGFVQKYAEIFLEQDKIWRKSNDHFSFEMLEIVLDSIKKSLGIAKYTTSIHLFGYLVHWPNDFLKNGFDKIMFATSILLGIYFINNILQGILFSQKTFKQYRGSDVGGSFFSFISRFIVVFIWILGIVGALGTLGYDITPILAGASVSGVAIAFAAQKSIGNIFGAFIILANKPFYVGEFVKIGVHRGTIQKIGLSFITMVEHTGNQVSIPNETILSGPIQNYSRREFYRTDGQISIRFDASKEDLNISIGIIDSVLEKYESLGQIKSGFRVFFDSFGAYSLNIKFTYFSLKTETYVEYVNQKEQINLDIRNELTMHGIKFAYPTNEVVMKNSNGETLSGENVKGIPFVPNNSQN